jgi:hypothetical protein
VLVSEGLSGRQVVLVFAWTGVLDKRFQ